MRYICKKDYSGKIASGATVAFSAGSTFESIGEYIAFNNQGICRINSQFAKEYFEPLIEDIQFSPAKAPLKAKTSPIANETTPSVIIISVGECPLSGVPDLISSDTDIYSDSTIVPSQATNTVIDTNSTLIPYYNDSTIEADIV